MQVTAADFAWSVERTKLVQIDSVNVVERAHYMPFFARLGPFDRAALDQWIYGERQMFEHARNLEFEKAARVRDQLALLREQVLGGAGHDVNVMPLVPPAKAAGGGGGR